MKSSNKLFDLTGSTALITGGGSGLGKHFAQILSAAGAEVILCGRRLDVLKQVCAEIEQSGGRAVCVQMDVSDAQSITAAFAQIEKYGPITILINNAGLMAEPSLLDLTEQEWDRVNDVNLKGAWLVAKATVKQMIAKEVTGSVINIASVLGSCVQKGTGPYAASKAGLLHLTRSMALEWARYGIRVNAISPGYYVTDMAGKYLETEKGKGLLKRIPQRRLGEFDDLSGPILLLASDASAYMTGSMMTVDGGLSMSVIE